MSETIIVEEVVIKNSKELAAYLKSTEGTVVDKQFVIDTIESFSTSSIGNRRGQLAGFELGEMSDEQLKREVINSKSVLYKAVKRDAGQDTIDKNQARVDAVMAEVNKRKALAAPATTAVVDNTTSESVDGTTPETTDTVEETPDSSEF